MHKFILHLKHGKGKVPDRKKSKELLWKLTAAQAKREHDARKTKTCTECAEQTLYDSCGYTVLQLKFCC